jgi:hypothetical protein
MWEPGRLAGLRAVLATKHGKEQVVAPALARVGLVTEVAAVDTDGFGTFTRTVPRAGTQREAALAKARAALEACPEALVGVSSEGAYGPHPMAPWLGRGVELVVAHFRDGPTVVGRFVTMSVPCGHEVVDTVAAGNAWAARFPRHHFVVAGLGPGTEGAPHAGLAPGPALDTALRQVLEGWPSSRLELDLRAMLHPDRMAAVGSAATDLATRLAAPCPACGSAGFGPERVEVGLPCSNCGGPTNAVRQDVSACPACGHETAIERPGFADPGTCPRCNP